jgi:putative flippase GtrA
MEEAETGLLKETQHHGLRFAVVGVVGCGVDIAVLYACLWLGTGFYLGRAVSFLMAATATWLLNRAWTFRERRSNQPLWREWLHYLSLMLIGGAFNYAIYVLCIAQYDLMKQYPFLAVMVGSVAGMVANYLSARFLIFRHQTTSPDE